MNKNVVISKMELSDLDDISTILVTEFDDFWSYNIFKQELLNENSKYVIAKINDEIVGFGGIWKSIDDAHITNIVTKKAYRNKGIGSNILEKLIEMSKELKVNSLTLEVSEKNIAAQNLYKKYNFKILGKRKKYYKNIDAIIMTLYF